MTHHNGAARPRTTTPQRARPPMRRCAVLLASTLAFGLAGCGGGGGGGDETATDDRLQLTSSNYVTAGNEAVDASESGTLLVIDAGSYLVPETSVRTAAVRPRRGKRADARTRPASEGLRSRRLCTPYRWIVRCRAASN